MIGNPATVCASNGGVMCLINRQQSHATLGQIDKWRERTTTICLPL